MKRKISHKLSLICLLIAYPAANALAYDHFSSFSGLTVGAGLGLTALMTNTASDTFASNSSNSASNTLDKYGPLGNVFIGYGKTFTNNFYLGGELGLNIAGSNETSLKNTTKTNTVTNDLNIIPGFPPYGTVQNSTTLSTLTKVSGSSVIPILDIKPGFLLAPNILTYARFGLSYNSIEVKSESSYQAVGNQRNDEYGIRSSFLSASSTFTNSETKHLIGLRAGLGFEYLLTTNLGLGADYVYTFYRTVNLTATGQSNQVACDVVEGCTVNHNGNYATSNRSNVGTQDVMLQLIYHIT